MSDASLPHCDVCGEVEYACRCSKGEMKPEKLIVNRSYPTNNSRCWCPLCEQEKQKVGILAPWISPVGDLVCMYGVCKTCGDTVLEQSEDLRSRFMDRVERNLLHRYPELQGQLPPGYIPAARGI